MKLAESFLKVSHGSSMWHAKERAEMELLDPWFPFRRPIDFKSVQDRIVDTVCGRVQRGELDIAQVRWCSIRLLSMILQAHCSTAARVLPDCSYDGVFRLSKHVVQGLISDCGTRTSDRMVEEVEKSFLSGLGQAMTGSEGYRSSQQYGLAQDLATLHKVASSCSLDGLCCVVEEILVSLSPCAAAIQDICSCGMSEPCIRYLLHKWQDGSSSRASTMAGILRFLAVSQISDAFFTSDTVQAMVGGILSALSLSATFTLAINSSPDEYPSELNEQMNALMFLRCCLSTRYASASLLRCEDAQNMLLAFITDTLSGHGEVCMSTCGAEDVCTVAFELAAAMSTSVPAALCCASLFADKKIVSLSAETSNEGPIFSPCSLLATQLQNMYELVGGPSEKPQRCALPDFVHSADQSSQETRTATGAQTNSSGEVTLFVQSLLEKMLFSIQDSCNRSASLDFVMLSQATWELINDIEGAEVQSSSMPSLQLTKVFGKLMYHLVLSKRSRLDGGASSTGSTALPTVNSEKDFPLDAERKVMNKVYKRYCHRLGLRASPTTLHCIVKKFGRFAIDSFPVTVLMILDQFCSEKETIEFLSCCWTSRSAAFLWPAATSSLSGCGREGEAVPVLSNIAIAVEFILGREYPQVSHAHYMEESDRLAIVLIDLSVLQTRSFDALSSAIAVS